VPAAAHAATYSLDDLHSTSNFRPNGNARPLLSSGRRIFHCFQDTAAVLMVGRWRLDAGVVDLKIALIL